MVKVLISDLAPAVALEDTDIFELQRIGDPDLSLKGTLAQLRLSMTQFHGCLLAKGATESVTTAGAVNLAWSGADVYDTDAFHNPASNNTKIIIPAAFNGYMGEFTWGLATATANGLVQAMVVRGGVSFPGTGAQMWFANQNTRMCGSTAPVLLATGDEFELNVLVVTANRTIEVDNRTYFGLRILGKPPA